MHTNTYLIQRLYLREYYISLKEVAVIQKVF